ncbi:MAG TPA: twin-arginine translocase subunit TatC [Mariniflexile sp.]
MENTSPVEPTDFKSLIDKYSPFLVEARKRLIFTVSVFGVSTLAGFFFYKKIIRLLVELLSLQGVNIVFTSPFQFINLAFNTGLAFGLVISFPILIFQVLSFLKPALKGREYKMVTRLLPFSLILFLTGLVFGFFIMRWQVKIFLTTSTSLGIGNVLDINRLLTTVLMTSVIMGIGFQFPIVLLLLIRLGIVKRQKLSKFRLWIYIGSFVFAVLLPVDSIIADILLTIPLILLFEMTLLLSKVQKEKRTQKS